jgi:hypothetical protein
MRTAPMLAMAMSLLAAACSKDTQLDSIARELETTVNRCVIDVRDKTSKYETSPKSKAGPVLTGLTGAGPSTVNF